MEPITLAVAAVVGLGVLCWAVNLGRNRPFTKDVPVFRASRWTKGNRIWPTQVAVFPGRVVRYTPRLFGHFEETIGIDQVASVSVDSQVLLGEAPQTGPGLQRLGGWPLLQVKQTDALMLEGLSNWFGI